MTCRVFTVALGVIAIGIHGIRAEDEPSAGKPLSEQHHLLDKLAGNWEVDTTYRLAGQEHHSSARCETKWILDGHVLRQEYHSNMNGRPFTVIQLLGYDPAAKKFWEIKMDSMDPGVMHNEGVASDNGKSITMTGKRTDPRTGQTTSIRTVTHLEDADHYTLDWYLPGAHGKEEKTVTLRHTRRSP